MKRVKVRRERIALDERNEHDREVLDAYNAGIHEGFDNAIGNSAAEIKRMRESLHRSNIINSDLDARYREAQSSNMLRVIAMMLLKRNAPTWKPGMWYDVGDCITKPGDPNLYMAICRGCSAPCIRDWDTTVTPYINKPYFVLKDGSIFWARFTLHSMEEVLLDVGRFVEFQQAMIRCIVQDMDAQMPETLSENTDFADIETRISQSLTKLRDCTTEDGDLRTVAQLAGQYARDLYRNIPGGFDNAQTQIPYKRRRTDREERGEGTTTEGITDFAIQTAQAHYNSALNTGHRPAIEINAEDGLTVNFNGGYQEEAAENGESCSERPPET
jgi:hypothetical protein